MKKMLNFSVFSMLFITIIIVMNNNTKNKEKEILGAPTNEIILNDDTNYKFVVPTDSISLFQSEYIEDLKFENYVQNDKTEITLNKEVLFTYEDTKRKTANFFSTSVIKPLPNGGYVSTLLFNGGSSASSKQMLIYVDPSGNIKDIFEGQESNTLRTRFEGVFDTPVTIQGDSYGFQVLGKGLLNGTYSPVRYDFKIVNEKIELYGETLLNIGEAVNVNPSGVNLGNDEFIYAGSMGTTVGLNTKTITTKNYLSQGIQDGTFSTYPKDVIYNNPATTLFDAKTFGLTAIAKGGGDENYLLGVLAGSNSNRVRTSWDIYDSNFNFIMNSAILENDTNVSSRLMTDITDDNTKYLFNYSNTNDVEFGSVDMSTGEYTVRKRLPKKSSFYFTDNSEENDLLSFFGYLSTATEEFSRYGITNSSLIFGTLSKEDYSVRSATGIPLPSGTNVTIQKAVPLNIDDKGYGKYAIVGSTNGVFDKAYPNNNASANSNTKYLYGTLTSSKVFSPIIEKLEGIEINTSNDVTEDMLLVGNNGEHIKTYDSNQTDGGNTSVLDSLINKNPINKELPIDWISLGYDEQKIGSQSVTYFVTNQYLLSTSTSRIITNIKDTTRIQDQSYLDSRNFNISLNEIKDGGLSNNTKIKDRAEIVAWEKEELSYAENVSQGIYNDSKVTFPNDTQVEAIKKATVAKPYPLDIQYKGSSTVTNRIWVFVTNENTTVDNGVVLYADDFSLPLKQAADSTAESILKKKKFKQTQPGVVAYDYVAQPQDVKELTPLSKGKTDGTSKGLSSPVTSMTKITDATAGKVIPNFEFTYTNPTDNKVTTVKVTVTIDEEKEFCFTLERTKEKLKVVDPVIDATVSENYKSIEVQVPIHVSLDASVATPTGWEKMTGVTETASQTYQYNMKAKNDKQSIADFLTSLTFTIDDPVDKPGEVVITLREDELLKNTSAKTKASVGKKLSTSVVIEKNDFRLEAESKWDDTADVSYVELGWSEISNLTASGYQLYQSEDSVEWNSRSLNYGKQLKVLNIYPDIAASNTLKSWMDGLGLKDNDGNDLIKVTPVSLTAFNTNPKNYLEDSNTEEYMYDVVMVGSYDNNNALEVSTSGITELKNFLDAGRGVLWGHDTVTGRQPDLAEVMAPYIGLGYNQIRPLRPRPDVVQPEELLWVGSEEVSIVNNGYLMKYPFELSNDAIFNIPYTHNIEMQDIDIGTTWLEFVNPSGVAGNPIVEKIGLDGRTYRNGWYLKTNNNIGMIQTGHSNGASTINERMIIANTLYNLAQVSLDNNGKDYSVKDDVAPEVTKVTRNKENKVTIEGEDFGKTYQFYVTADTKDKSELKSDVVETDVISDMKGFIYEIDTNPGAVPSVTKDAFGNVTNINATVVNPNVSRSATISGLTDTTEWLHILPVDRANNVGDVVHIQVKDIEFDETPEDIGCSGLIPQKVYIKGKDDQGNALTEGDQVLETALRVGKKVSFTPTTIEWYTYENLQKLDGTKITPEEFTIEGTKQDAEAIYTRSLTKLHVRQVILDSNKNLVEPLFGEGVIQNTDTLGGVSQAELPINYPTNDKAVANYKTITYAVNTSAPFYRLEAILPEYYQYEGHVLTTTNQVHNEASKVAGLPQWDITANPEVWITMYVTPNSSGGANPGLYGWGYGKNGTYQLVP